MLETKEQTYLLSSPKVERKKSKSRSLFKRNKKYAQMKKSSWKKSFSRKQKSAKSDVKEESREFAGVTNASPKEEMSTDDLSFEKDRQGEKVPITHINLPIVIHRRI